MPSPIDQWKTQDATYDLGEQDAWKAWQRIGVRPESIVQWALGWLNQRPDSDSEWLALRREIGALGSMFFDSPVEHWADFIQKKLATRKKEEVLRRLPVQREADRFLSMLSGCVKDLLSGSLAQVGPLSVRVCITRRDRKIASIGHSKELKPRPDRFTDEPIYKVLQALQVCGGLVNCCPECNELFLADRTNKVFCTIKCQNVVTSRRFREKQKTEKSKRKKKRVASRQGSAGA